MTAQHHIWTNTATLDDHLGGLALGAAPHEATVALIGSKPFPIDDMPHLRGVFRCGVGTDNIPFEACAARGIEVCVPSESTIDFIHEETANFAVYLTLRMLYMDIGTLDPWRKKPRPFLGDQVILVVGAGNIGGRVVQKLKPLVDVRTFDSATDDADTLAGQLQLADVVTLHVPLHDGTRGMVDAAWLGSMKDSAALVNTARGPIVDEAALLAELQAGRLRAAFDVYWKEPYTCPLAQLPEDRFLMSPHVASMSEGFLAGLAGDFTSFLNVLSLEGAAS
jgi:phosphoglycerate dehydrogenase-like enzyme